MVKSIKKIIKDAGLFTTIVGSIGVIACVWITYRIVLLENCLDARAAASEKMFHEVKECDYLSKRPEYQKVLNDIKETSKLYN